MAVTEEGGGRSPASAESKRDRGLAKWDAPEPAPRAPVGAIFRPPAATSSSRFDTARLKKLTPFAAPVEVEPTSDTSTSSYGGLGQTDEDKPLSSTTSRSQALQQMPTAKDEAEDTTLEKQGKEKTRRSYRLTWDEYNKLSDEKRAAVDFNTLMVRAREKDLNADYDTPSEVEKEAYDAEVTRMFGEGRGSETFAPETLAVLKQIDFKSNGTDDLDDFLSLKDTISAKELKDFSFDKELASPQVSPEPQADLLKAISPGGAGGLDTDQRVAVYTDNLRESMTRTNTLLQNFKAAAASDRNSYVEGFGGELNKVNQAMGYGTGEFDTYFRNAFEYLSREGYDDKTRAEMLDALHTELDPKQLAAFAQYADERTRNAVETKAPLGQTPEVKYLNPVDLRALLQLDKGER